MDLTVPTGQSAVPGRRIPLGAAVVDARGLVSRWSAGAGRLLGVPTGRAVGRSAADVLPISGVLADHGLLSGEDCGPAAERAGGVRAAAAPVGFGGRQPAAGRARSGAGAVDRVPLDVLWWAYPLAGPASDRLLVLVADASLIPGRPGVSPRYRCLLPGFASPAGLAGAEDFAVALAAALRAEPRYARRLAARVLLSGRPVLDSAMARPVAGSEPRGREGDAPLWVVPAAAAERGGWDAAVRPGQAVPGAGAH